MTWTFSHYYHYHYESNAKLGNLMGHKMHAEFILSKVEKEFQVLSK